MCDVTVSIRFVLEKNGLYLLGKKTKESIIGFYNPIPQFLREHKSPTLCIIYQKPNEGENIYIEYFKDSEPVKLEIEE